MSTNDYGFYSKVLKQPFDTLEELRAAEAKLAAANKFSDERKEAAKVVNEAYKNYIETAKKANDMLSEARKNYENKKAEFQEKYEKYHATYTSADGKEFYEEMGSILPENLFSTATSFAKMVNEFLSK